MSQRLRYASRMQTSIIALGSALKTFSPVVAGLSWASQSPGGRYNRVLGPTLRKSDSVVPGGGPRSRIFNKFPGEADAAGLEATLQNHWPGGSDRQLKGTAQVRALCGARCRSPGDTARGRKGFP